MKKYPFFLERAVLLALIITSLVFGVFADAVAVPSYKGKVMTLVVPTTAGGGGDIWARMITRHLPRFIPGSPSIVVRNMPAAGGLIGANFVWHAKPNGKTMLFCTGKTIMSNILRPKGTDYKLQEMHPVYASPFGVVYYSKTELVPKPKDIVNAKGLIWGHSAATGGTSTLWIFAKAVLGVESKDILGYGGSGPSRLAFIAGETNVTGAGSDSYVASFKTHIEKGEAVVVFQSGLLDADGNVIRDKVAPPAPTPKELYEEIYGKPPSGPFWNVYRLALGTRAYDNSIVLPPTTPPDYVNIVRKAFEDMSHDPDFLKDSEHLAAGATHIVGEKLTRGYAAGVSGTAETVEFMKKYLNEKYGVRFD